MENQVEIICLECGSNDLIISEDIEYEDIWYKCNECKSVNVIAD